MNDKRERSIFKNSFSCFMTDRSATEQEVNNILSHDISHELKSLKCFKFIQLSDVCWRNISYWKKAQYSFRWTQQLYKWAIYNIHFKVCIPILLRWHWRSKISHLFLKNQGIEKIQWISEIVLMFVLSIFPECFCFIITNHMYFNINYKSTWYFI